MEIGVPATVPNRRPLAPARSWPGKNAHDSAADSGMNSSGAQAPAPSTMSRTCSGERETVRKTTRASAPQTEGQRGQPQAMAHAAARA